MAGIVDILQNWQAVLRAIGPIVSILLILIGGLGYGFGQTQPAESRGRWQVMATGAFVGGVMVAAITATADTFEKIAEKLLV
ncbi:hypothetical protein HY570_03935 [Candidatus Micrarchaeota archaeon]|nr:hypothetical protein [Candidatus Micrarchaeota archaeon]